MEKIEINPSKHYVRRDGKIAGKFSKIAKSEEVKYFDEKYQELYTPDGKHINPTNPEGNDAPEDLVDEYIDTSMYTDIAWEDIDEDELCNCEACKHSRKMLREGNPTELVVEIQKNYAILAGYYNEYPNIPQVEFENLYVMTVIQQRIFSKLIEKSIQAVKSMEDKGLEMTEQNFKKQMSILLDEDMGFHRIPDDKKKEIEEEVEETYFVIKINRLIRKLEYYNNIKSIMPKDWDMKPLGELMELHRQMEKMHKTMGKMPGNKPQSMHVVALKDGENFSDVLRETLKNEIDDEDEESEDMWAYVEENDIHIKYDADSDGIENLLNKMRDIMKGKKKYVIMTYEETDGSSIVLHAKPTIEAIG